MLAFDTPRYVRLKPINQSSLSASNVYRFFAFFAFGHRFSLPPLIPPSHISLFRIENTGKPQQPCRLAPVIHLASRTNCARVETASDVSPPCPIGIWQLVDPCSRCVTAADNIERRSGTYSVFSCFRAVRFRFRFTPLSNQILVDASAALPLAIHGSCRTAPTSHIAAATHVAEVSCRDGC
jgi:hypothetical protein